MAKLTLNNITTGYASNTLQNTNNDLIEAALENTLSRDGTTPNTMEADLDLNNNQIINLGAPLNDNDAARLVDVQSAISGLPTASLVPNTPAGNISATNVQAALNELDTEKTPVAFVSLMPTVASATTPDIFGATGATINYTGTTTATGFTACTAAQVGSKKTIIPVTGASFTASASFVIDGATSNTYLMPAGAVVEVIATSTTTFKVTTIFATGTWTPEYVLGTPGTSSFGTYSVQLGYYTKIGNKVTAQGSITCGTFSLGTGSGTLYIKTLPFTPKVQMSGCIGYSSAYVTLAPTQGYVAASDVSLRLVNTTSATVTLLNASNCASSLRTEFVMEYFV